MPPAAQQRHALDTHHRVSHGRCAGRGVSLYGRFSLNLAFSASYLPYRSILPEEFNICSVRNAGGMTLHAASSVPAAAPTLTWLLSPWRPGKTAYSPKSISISTAPSHATPTTSSRALLRRNVRVRSAVHGGSGKGVLSFFIFLVLLP